MVLNDKVCAAKVSFRENCQLSQTTKYFWDEYSPHLVYRNPDKQFFKCTTEVEYPKIDIIFNNGKTFMLLGCSQFKDPKPIFSLVNEFISVAGYNDIEYEKLVKSGHNKRNDHSWTTCGVNCICKIRGQLPCPHSLKFPRPMRQCQDKMYGTRSSFGHPIKIDDLPEGTTHIFSPIEKRHYLTFDKPKRY